MRLVSSREYVAPESPVEKALAEIWRDLLRLERIGIHDHFFELGGHSLLATQLLSRLHKQLSVDVPLHWVFKAPTVADLAELVELAMRSARLDDFEAKESTSGRYRGAV